MASDDCGRISHFSDRASGMPVSWNPTVTLLQKKREEMQNTGVTTIEIESNTVTISQNSHADECAVLSCSAIEGEVEEQQNDLDGKVCEDKNEISNSNSHETDVVQNAENLSDRTEAKIQRSQDDSKLIRIDPQHETDDKKISNTNATRRCSWSPPDASYRLKRYQNQPMKIENYEPGMSSVVLQDPFINNYYNPPIEKPGEHCKYTVSNPNVKYRIRKANGAVSPSLSETSVHDLYRKVQKGGEIPLEGLWCPIPPVKAHRFFTGQRNISSNLQPLRDPSTQKHSDSKASSTTESLKADRPHSASAASTCAYVLDRRTKDELSAARKRELEVALAEARRKRLIEEAESNKARRHSDYFHSRIKSPVALNRYDLDDAQFRSGSSPTSPSPVDRPLVKAQALYTFKAQTNRELSLNKGDTVYILRLIDKNWFEGQRHGTVGIFPVNYVEVLESHREQNYKDRGNLSVAKFDFTAEYPAELSFQKGDVLKLIQAVDSNWYEAAIGHRSGLVPKAYVEPLQDHLSVPLTIPVGSSSTEISQHDSPGTMSSTSSCLSSGLEPLLLTSSRNFQGSEWTTNYSATISHPMNIEMDPDAHDKSTKQRSILVLPSRRRSNSLGAADSTSNDPRSDYYGGTMTSGFHCHHPDTSEDDLDFERMKFVQNQNTSKPNAYYYAPESRYGTKRSIESNEYFPYIVCHALFSYSPQDEDELELSPGDIVYVTEIFDDGWYVGISQRTNAFGTFPGNYVQRLRLCHVEPCTV